MIIDSILNSAMYEQLNPRFKKAFEYLRSNDLAAMEPGKYEVDGKEIFINLQDATLKLPENAAMEVHDKYIDIQFVIKGNETFGWRDRAQCATPKGEMNTEKDVLFFEDKPSTYFTLHDGEFCILFPGDGHAPCIGDGTVRKCIVKVMI